MELTTEVERDPPSIAVINDYEVVVRGVATMLAPFADRVRVVELDCGVMISQPVNVALYDAYAMSPGIANVELDLVARNAMIQHPVLYTWAITPQVVQAAEERRMSGVLSKSLEGHQLVDAIEQICAGETVVSLHLEGDEGERMGDWPGREQGLTPRQSEMIVLIVAGLTNQQIASSCYLSINSVKSYIRAAYHTMGVDSRSQAILWGIDHGFRSRPRARLFPREGDSETFEVSPDLVWAPPHPDVAQRPSVSEPTSGP